MVDKFKSISRNATAQALNCWDTIVLGHDRSSALTILSRTDIASFRDTEMYSCAINNKILAYKVTCFVSKLVCNCNRAFCDRFTQRDSFPRNTRQKGSTDFHWTWQIHTKHSPIIQMLLLLLFPTKQDKAFF